MYRKGISALIKNSNNDFLLVNLQSFKEEYYAIPGGGLEEGESLDYAVYREIKEELGIQISNLTLVNKSSLPLKTKFIEIVLHRNGKEYIGSERFFYAFIFNGTDKDIVINTNEIRKYKWVKVSDFNKYLLFKKQLKQTTDKITELFS